MRAIVSLIVPSFLAVGLVACAGQEVREAAAPPAWVTGESERYPAGSYLVGRGQADRADRARDRARADLAKSVEVSVSARTRDTQRYTRSRSNDAAARSQSEQAVSREVTTHAERVLRGVEIVDQWRDPESGTHHALAVLARSRAAAGLREEIARLDERAVGHLQRARSASDPLTRAVAADAAVAAQRERAALQETLRSVSATGQGVPTRWNLGRLEADRDELLGRITIRPVATGPRANDLSSLVAEAVSGAGMTVADEGAAYRLVARLDHDAPRRRDGWYWIHGTLSVSLEDAQGVPLGGERWPLKVSATERDLARRRVVDRAGEMLAGRLLPTLAGFAEARASDEP